MKKLSDLKLLIIGLGQIGGSLGYDLTGSGAVKEVIGFDINTKTVSLAKRLGAVDRTVRSLERGIKQADIIILAMPIRKIVKSLPKICRLARNDSIIMDIAGTKSEIAKTLSKVKNEICYFSGHPIAGTEKIGFDGATKGLFKNTVFAVTSLKNKSNESFRIINQLIKKLEAKPLEITADEHDRLIAITSQLPYLFALSLANIYVSAERENRDISKLIGGSFRSATRVAASSQELTLDMFMTNKKNLSTIIDLTISDLISFKKLINGKKESAIRKIIKITTGKSQEIQNG